MNLQFDSNGINNNVFPLTTNIINKLNLAKQEVSGIEIPSDFAYNQMITGAFEEIEAAKLKTVDLNSVLDDKITGMNRAEAANLFLSGSFADRFAEISGIVPSEPSKFPVAETRDGKRGIFNIPGFGTLEDFTALIRQYGITNQGTYGGMQCHNYSNAYGAWMMQDPFMATPNFPGLEKKGSKSLGFLLTKKNWNSMPFRPIDMTGMSYGQRKEESQRIIQAELDQGRPVVIRVSSGSGTHYGLAVQYVQNGSGVMTGNDIIYIDSYDGKIKQLDDDKNNGRRRLAVTVAQTVWVYDPSYSYKYGTRDAWMVATNNPTPLNSGGVHLTASSSSQYNYQNSASSTTQSSNYQQLSNPAPNNNSSASHSNNNNSSSNNQQAFDMPTLKLNSSGPEVIVLQKMLTLLKFYYGPVYGDFDLMTQNAVIEFQKSNNLEATGIVDYETWKVLFSNDYNTYSV